MKVIPTALAAQYGQATTTICACLKMTRRDGTVIGLTSLDDVLVVSGLTYVPGLEISNIESTNTLGVDNLDLTILPDDDELLEADLLAGIWDNCTFEIFEVNYLSVADGVNTVKRGTGGEVQALQGKYVIELRGLTQALQQTVGLVTSRTCRAHFADWPTQALSARCGLDPADWTVTGTVTMATSRQTFTDTARSEPGDWFTEGFVTFNSGGNAGYTRQVRSFSLSVFGLVLPFPFDIAVGDTYSAIAGCRKRLLEDCKAKFNNVLNFQGEPHLPGVDALTKTPGVGE